MPLDRPIGQEEGRRDLTIRLSLGDERSDPLLRGCQRSRRSGPTADALELGTGAFRPDRCTEPLEHCERLAKGLARLAAALRSPLRHAEGEQRASAIEGNLHLRVPHECALVGGNGVVERSELSGEQAAAARARGKRRCALEPSCVPFVPVQELDRVVSSSELDQRLDLVDDEPDGSWLDDPLAADEGDTRLQLRNDVVRRAEREVDVAARRRRDEPDLTVVHQLERASGRLPRLLGTTEVRLGEAFEREVVRGEERLAGLFGRLSPGESPLERPLELLAEDFHLTEQEQDVRPRALVPELVHPSQQLDQRVA